MEPVIDIGGKLLIKHGKGWWWGQGGGSFNKMSKHGFSLHLLIHFFIVADISIFMEHNQDQLQPWKF